MANNNDLKINKKNKPMLVAESGGTGDPNVYKVYIPDKDGKLQEFLISVPPLVREA